MSKSDQRRYRYASPIAIGTIIVCISAIIGLIVVRTSPSVTAFFYWLGVGFSWTIAVLVLSIIWRMIVRRVYPHVASNDLVGNRAPPVPAANVCTTEMIPASLPPEASGLFSYAIERLPDCVMEINAHACAHWSEMASRTDIRTLAVDWEAYLAADRVGRVTLGTARRGGKLIGYLCMVQRTDLHSKDTVTAESAFYYVERRPMRGLVERNLIRFVLGQLGQRGIKYVRFRNKVSHSNAPILKSLGFVPDEISYVLEK